ncbi:hypothetical protein D3C72_1335240 [compost metagenome]
MPRPTEARSFFWAFHCSSVTLGAREPNTLPTSKKPYRRSVRSLPAPGNGVLSSALKMAFLVPPSAAPSVWPSSGWSRGPSEFCSKPRIEPRPPA